MSYSDLENMSSEQFQEFFDSIPSDAESVRSDEEGDSSVAESESEYMINNDIEDNNIEIVPPLFEVVENQLAEERGNGFSSEDDLPLSRFCDSFWSRNIRNEPVVPFTNCTGPKNFPDDVEMPYEVFLCLFPEDLLDIITFQTNLYAIQKGGGATDFPPITLN
ncbi:hypothetical protein JTB14_012584 [Gonioctena quinquepunctata]|nr:hypothetical protein JTB14_012584 [Gonioctena quinquepunctata]